MPPTPHHVAIVTGANHGIGAATAERLASGGAVVLITYLRGRVTDDPATPERYQQNRMRSGEEVVDRIVAGGGRAIALEADLLDAATPAMLFDRAEAEFGGVDILINNAGLCRGKWSGGLALSAEDWNLIFAVNAVAPLVCARACRETMKARGGGVVINASSCASYAEFGAYSVTKLALNGINNILANELGVDNIRVNAIAPGLMHGRVSAEEVAGVLVQQKLKRRGDPKDLIGGLLYLCSDRSSFVTGTVLRIDGGFVRAHV